MTHTSLLAPTDPPPYEEHRIDGTSDFFITVDHASPRIPGRLGDLGVSAAERARHIAWDIGALGIARALSEKLDATLVATSYSRLVIDCNRDPAMDTSIPTVSEYTPIPGNEGLSAEGRAARVAEIFEPYHRRITDLLDARRAAGRETILVAQHSMTDVYKGNARAMHAAVLYNRDRRFAGAVLDALRAQSGLVIADNEPYFVSDATDYTVPVHAERRGLLHVEIEVRQDLVASESGQHEWAGRLADALLAARKAF